MTSTQGLFMAIPKIIVISLKNSRRCIIYATAYLITLSGAKKLLNYAYPIRIPADYLTGLIQKTYIRAYGVEPPCVFRGLSSDSEINQIEHRYE